MILVNRVKKKNKLGLPVLVKLQLNKKYTYITESFLYLEKYFRIICLIDVVFLRQQENLLQIVSFCLSV